MSALPDRQELKALAENVMEAFDGHFGEPDMWLDVDALDLAAEGMGVDGSDAAVAKFLAALSPSIVLALVADNERTPEVSEGREFFSLGEWEPDFQYALDCLAHTRKMPSDVATIETADDGFAYRVENWREYIGRHALRLSTEVDGQTDDDLLKAWQRSNLRMDNAVARENGYTAYMNERKENTRIIRAMLAATPTPPSEEDVALVREALGQVLTAAYGHECAPAAYLATDALIALDRILEGRTL